MKKATPKKPVFVEEEEIVERKIEKPEEVFRNPVGYSQFKEEKKRSGCVLWFIAIICVIALVVGIGGLFTEATITIAPKTFEGTIDMTLPLSQTKTPTGVSFATATKTFTEEVVVPATGISDKETYATGTVRFYNSTSASKTIQKGSVIISSTQKEYKTVKNITIPAIKGKTPGQSDVQVTAMVAGAESNNDLDDFVFQKPGKATTGITIRSVTAITGGAIGKDALADPAAINQAGETLKAKFSNSEILMKRMAEEIPDTTMVLPVVFPTSTPVVTTEANHTDGVHVIAKETVVIILVDKSEIARALGNNLQAPEGIKLTLNSFEGLTVTTSSISANLPIPTTIQVRITGTTTVTGSIDESQIVTKIRGSYRTTAKKVLSENLEIDSFQIRMRPFWRRTLPSQPDDISVVKTVN